MAILQGILALVLLIGFFEGVYCLVNKLIDLMSNKQEDKPEVVVTTDGGRWLINQLCLGIRDRCDYIQDDGVFRTYPPDYTVWESNFKYGNIRDLSSYIELKRVMPYYELVLQTNTSLKYITSLDKEIIYRVIVLKKYKKEIEPMGKKKLNLDDKDMLISIRQYIYHFIDYSEVGCNRQSYTDKIYEEEYQMDFQDLKSKKFANIIFNIRARFYDRDKYCIVIQLSKSFYDMYQKDDYITIKLIVVDQKYNQVVKALKEVLGETKTMDEKQKILNNIEEAQHKLDEARKKLDEYNTGNKRWKPKNNEKFWYIDSSGSVNYSLFMSETESRFKNYNCFQTKEQAEAEAEKILVRRQLADIAKRLNKGQKIDWSDDEQLKYYFYLYRGNVYGAYNKLIFDLTRTKKQQGTVYCLDENFLDIAKREIGEDRLIKYIRGED